MNRDERQFVMWITLAGILFLIVAVHDLVFLTTIDKSRFMIALEMVGGLGFLLNALMHWKKYR